MLRFVLLALVFTLVGCAGMDSHDYDTGKHYTAVQSRRLAPTTTDFDPSAIGNNRMPASVKKDDETSEKGKKTGDTKK